MHLKALEQRAECHASLHDLDSAIADWELLGRSAAVEAATKKTAAKRLVEARATKNQIPRQAPLVQTPARRHVRPRAARPPACGAPTRVAAAHAPHVAPMWHPCGRGPPQGSSSDARHWPARHREEHSDHWPQSQKRRRLFLSATSRQVLGLGPAATEAEVRKAYKSLCLAHHPDKHAAGTAEAQTRAKFRFARIQAAYAKMSSAAGSLPSYRSPFGRSAWGEYE